MNDLMWLRDQVLGALIEDPTGALGAIVTGMVNSAS
jgi:hypothetical protein